ncbi:hypothetical protein DPEC_G00147660 [Dallia pectoralis]|uniref:Uncharacterized protein n=1 Tax=Dallia pectoralis TaxID=75939 RepID=A0ACC2GI13_DALPE|nr:hypothetical protein DPEC_G00147660 [Dallia pectoralis]
MDTLYSHHQEKETSVLIEEEEEKIHEKEDECKTTEKESVEKTEETEPQQEKVKPWVPTCYSKFGKEVFYYVGEEISVIEGLGAVGAVTWPAALALCRYLETNVEKFNLVDKTVLELGAGPGLVSIVSSLLGAWVTATDLPEIVGNLRANLLRNTRGRCRHMPHAGVLSWGPDVQLTYPKPIYCYDYVLAADVVYLHDYLEDLLMTMKYFCGPGTTLIWANKIRFKADLGFTEIFKNAFYTTLLAEMGEVKIYMATCKETEEDLLHHPAG